MTNLSFQRFSFFNASYDMLFFNFFTRFPYASVLAHVIFYMRFTLNARYVPPYFRMCIYFHLVCCFISRCKTESHCVSSNQQIFSVLVKVLKLLEHDRKVNYSISRISLILYANSLALLYFYHYVAPCINNVQNATQTLSRSFFTIFNYGYVTEIDTRVFFQTKLTFGASTEVTLEIVTLFL